MDIASDYGRQGTVNINALVNDEEYQRAIVPKRLVAMKNQWDPGRFLPIVVNRRAGEDMFHVVDGHHRVETIRRLPDDIAKDLRGAIPATIREGLSQQQEAALFVSLQRDHKNPTLLEEFRAQIVGGIPEALAIQHVVRSAGLEVATPSSQGAGNIKAISALRTIYRRNGAEGMKTVLAISRGAWPDDRTDTYALSYWILLGLAQFERKYRNEFDVARMVNVLRPLLSVEIVKAARGLATANRLDTNKAMTTVLRDLYNKSFGRGNHGGRLS